MKNSLNSSISFKKLSLLRHRYSHTHTCTHTQTRTCVCTQFFLQILVTIKLFSVLYCKMNIEKKRISGKRSNGPYPAAATPFVKCLENSCKWMNLQHAIDISYGVIVSLEQGMFLFEWLQLPNDEKTSRIFFRLVSYWIKTIHFLLKHIAKLRSVENESFRVGHQERNKMLVIIALTLKEEFPRYLQSSAKYVWFIVLLWILENSHGIFLKISA